MCMPPFTQTSGFSVRHSKTVRCTWHLKRWGLTPSLLILNIWHLSPCLHSVRKQWISDTVSYWTNNKRHWEIICFIAWFCFLLNNRFTLPLSRSISPSFLETHLIGGFHYNYTVFAVVSGQVTIVGSSCQFVHSRWLTTTRGPYIHTYNNSGPEVWFAIHWWWSSVTPL